MKKTSFIFRSLVRSLPSLILLCTACSTYDISLIPSPVNLQNNVAQNDCNYVDIEQGKEDFFSYTESIMLDVIKHEIDPTIEVRRIQKTDHVESSLTGSQKETLDSDNLVNVLVTFRDFPGKPPYRVHMRRLLQEDPNVFLPREFEELLLNFMYNKNSDIPLSLGLSPQGFLPGERVTWRLSGTDGTIVKEVTVCPRPMILKDASGKIILEAALVSIHNSLLIYFIHMPALDEAVEFISTSGPETIRELLPLGRDMVFSYLPSVLGMEGGIAQIEIRFLKDGSSYKMQFPWGTALFNDSIATTVEKCK